VGCQTVSGGAIPAGSGRDVRLDPLALPVRFAAPDRTADGQMRLVELDRENVLVSRSRLGIAIRLRVPVRMYKGVALVSRGQAGPVLRLEHSDPDLCVELARAPAGADLQPDADVWGRLLRLPILAIEPNTLPAALPQLQRGSPGPRRRKHSSLKRRRPTRPLRRTRGQWGDQGVYREREIIARD
jgi:Family of unknown function (DUF6101)